MPIELVPPPDATRTDAHIPVTHVSVLEDRAAVRRTGRLSLPAGRHRLRVDGVAPVLQDVSLQASASVGQVSVARAVRALRIRSAERPDAVRELEDQARALASRQAEHQDRQQRAESRLSRLFGMAIQAAHELPEDAAWGRVDPDGWRDAFGALFERAAAEQQAAIDAWLDAEQTADDLRALHARLALLQRPDVDLACAIELDLLLDAPADVELSLAYVVPLALWRPLHRAALAGDSLTWTQRATVWQHTGEDWSDVVLTLSTARTALGTSPPLLDDDLLTVQRKSDEVRVEMREVEVQRAGPRGGAPDAVSLPGVDDGGEVRVLAVPGRVTIGSDGRPVSFDLGAWTGPASVARVACPEVLERVVVRVTAVHAGSEPLLAGPVELLRGGGAFGWTEVAFVAPGAALELSFGPDDTLRIRRHARVLSDKTDPVDRWQRVKRRVELDLSNVGTEPRRIELTERVPVSEIAEVRVEGLSATDGPSPDADGFVRWSVDIAPNAPRTLRLDYTLATAPGVQR